MEIKNKKEDFIKIINNKNKFIAKNTKLIDNFFLNKLYRNYLLSHRKKNHQNFLEMISEKPENKKLFEKMIIKNIVKKIPPNLLQYFYEFEFKNFANKLIASSNKKNIKKKKNYSSQKNKAKITYSRNKSISYRLNSFNEIYENDTYNEENKINIYEEENTRNLFEKKINQKKYLITTPNYKVRKYSSNILRNNFISLNENLAKEEFDNNKNNNNSSNFIIKKKLYNTMSSKNNKIETSIFNTKIFNTNKSANIIEDILINKPKSSKYLKDLNYNNTEIKNENESNKINNYMKKENNYKNIFLNLSYSNEKFEKKFDSKKLIGNNISNIKSDKFSLPKKKKKKELILSSLSPEEKVIIEKASNISNNLNGIKKEIKTERLKTPDNIKIMIQNLKKMRNKEAIFLKGEVNKAKCYEYFMKNKKQMEHNKEIFKILRNSFNTERNRRNANENSFIKTLNIICNEEKYFESIIKQVYKQNYWLRLNKNRKNAEDIKNRIDNINSKQILLNTLINKINKSNINNKKY